MSRRKSQRPQPEELFGLPFVVVWAYQPVTGGGGVTRFFFKERLNPYSRSDKSTFNDALGGLPGVFDVRLYAFYLAVQWMQPEAVAAKTIAQQVVDVGIATLKQHFGWQVVDIYDISDRHELAALRRQGFPGSNQWILGGGE